MITPDGWIVGVERLPGHPSKQNGGRNGLHGFVAHSAEGYQDYLLGNIIQRPASGGRKSWTFTNLFNGRLIQHYPIYSQVWTSGAGYPNNNMPSAECEGQYFEPLTDAQVNNLVFIIREIAAAASRTDIRRLRDGESIAPRLAFLLTEHRECTRWGADATACPSGRIPWETILERLTETESEGDEMYIVSKANTGDGDAFKSYLVRGKEFRHIPDSETFFALAALNLPLYEPTKVAWDFMIQGATVIN